MKRIGLILLSVFLVACSAKENVPNNVLPDNKMKVVLWDIMRAQFLAQHKAGQDSTINLDAETKVLTEKVFAVHKITSQDFDRSYNWYTAHPDKLQVMLDSLYTQKQRESNPETEKAIQSRKLLKRSIKEKPPLDE